MNEHKQILTRLRNGTPTEADLSWARQRVIALREWPDALTRKQQDELNDLTRYYP